MRLIALLQARPDWGGEELARRLGVTTRTVRADVRRLRELGCQVERTPGRAAGYRLRPGPDVPPMLFDDDEAVTVLTGLRLLAATSLGGLDETAERAMSKILRVLPERLRDQAQALATFIDADAGLDGDADPDLIRRIVSACDSRTRIRFAYRVHGFPVYHDVEPYQLVNVRRRWYLLAWDTADRGWRVFRADAIGLLGSYEGPRFEPRALPSEDPGAWVLSRIQAE